MGLQWEGKYEYEAGDIVEVIGENHPLAGQKGIVTICYSLKQFGVTFGATTVSLWTKNLKLVETHRYDSDIPDVFKDAFDS
jgi:hypothetical protein